MGPGMACWVVPGIALPGTHPATHTPGTPPLPIPAVSMTSVLPRGRCRRLNSAVGLKSVEQLSLWVQISGFEGITEVYNLVGIGRNNNHFRIPGTD